MKRSIYGTLIGMLISANVSAVEGWSAYHKISAIDSLSMDKKAYLSLENFTNANCSQNRILLTSHDDRHYDQMFSMILSAFHAGSEVKFYFPSLDNCDSTRILIRK